MGWSIETDGTDRIIHGEGMQIILWNFDQKKIRHDPAQSDTGVFLQRQWTYPLTPKGVYLECISTEHPEKVQQALHLLRIGTDIVWNLTEDIAELLHAAFK